MAVIFGMTKRERPKERRKNSLETGIKIISAQIHLKRGDVSGLFKIKKKLGKLTTIQSIREIKK